MAPAIEGADMTPVESSQPRFLEWMRQLKGRDPALHAELSARLKESAPPVPKGTLEASLESVPLLPGPPNPMVFETIVREGRPALLVQNNQMTRDDPSVEEISRTIADKLFSFADVLNPIIPLVGRIDVANYAGPLEYVGTAWLLEPTVVVTNRHVARLISRQGADGFTFAAGRFGDPLQVRVDYRHEQGVDAAEVVKVRRIIWIEPDEAKADIAFLEVETRSDGLRQDRILLAEADAASGADVAVVGYPARAPSSVIPDQAFMERLYAGHYDIKRIAPGLMGGQSHGWATHDCTTLGGNSGSVVLDMKTGRALALHFAGQYMVENYAVPASTIAGYGKTKPWQGAGRGAATETVTPRPVVDQAAGAAAGAAPAAGGASVTFNLPVTVTVQIGGPGPMVSASATVQSAPASLAEAVSALAGQLQGDGVLGVREGVVVENGAMVDEPCIVVAAHPARMADVQQRAPASWQGFRVQVRPGSLQDQLGEADSLLSEAPATIRYDDENRTGPEFSFDWIKERMQLRCHVGPERSFEELKAFLGKARGELVSSMYQFYVDHIREAVEGRLTANPPTAMKIVLDPQTHDSPQGGTPAGQFQRSTTFDRWAQDFGFQRIYVPEGSGGFVSKAYHIKVTVRDREAFWLSSGNWTKASQPLIPAAERMDPTRTGRAGNREWHVVGMNKTLAGRLRAHILQDFETCTALGGRPEAPQEEILVDVPSLALEAVNLEAAPSQVFEPLVVDRQVRVRPVLTPDGDMGGVYSDAVMELIQSATRQLLFQNQYITVSKSSRGRFSDLVDALIAQSRQVQDCRIILRADGTGFWDSIAELQRRGLDVKRCVRRLANTHTKGIIADGERVLVGSQNWSQAALTVNRDASLLFDDEEIAGYYAKVFEEDWARSGKLTDPPPAGALPHARIAEGPSPPDGFQRMTLGQYLE
jgi:hypothetical protein